MSDKLNLSYSQAFRSQDMRFALNVGSNFKLKDSLSLYFDFEKNFGGKINVEYQVNFGVSSNQTYLTTQERRGGGGG